MRASAFSDEALAADLLHPTIAFGQGPLGRTALERRLVHIPDIAADDVVIPNRSWFQHHGLSSLLGIPVVLGDSLIAVLSLVGAKPFALGAGEQDLLDAFVGQAAQAIWNARLFAETERREREASALFEVTRRLTATLDSGGDPRHRRRGHRQGHESPGPASIGGSPTQDSLVVSEAYNFAADLTVHFVRSGEGVAGAPSPSDGCAGPTTVCRRRRSTTLRRTPRHRPGPGGARLYRRSRRAPPRYLRGAGERPRASAHAYPAGSPPAHHAGRPGRYRAGECGAAVQ